MSARSLYIFTLGLLVLSFVGCQTARPFAANPPTDPEGIERNYGYALLYATIDDETRVDQVLMIKNPRAEVRDLLREITQFAKDAKEQLDALAEADDTLGYDEHGLPYAEAKTRDLITASTSRTIMFSAGHAFEINILSTQYEALNYITHLAHALREMDDDEDRRAFLTELAASAKSLHDRVVELLHSISSEAADS
jgi:hypothetical protein